MKKRDKVMNVLTNNNKLKLNLKNNKSKLSTK